MKTEGKRNEKSIVSVSVYIQSARETQQCQGSLLASGTVEKVDKPQPHVNIWNISLNKERR